MPGLDTDVLVRWLIADDNEQVARVDSVFELARGDRAMLFIPVTVALELE